jgi:hypothetical protein
MAMTLRVDGRQEAPFVRFLCEQAWQRWGVVVQRGDAPAGGFHVHLEELAGEQLAVRIVHDGELLTDRTVDARDALQAQVTLWLLMRSTVERGLKQAAVRAEEPEQERAAVPVAGAESGAAGRALASPALSAETRVAAGASEATAMRRTATLLATLWLETPELLAGGVVGQLGLEGRRLLLGGSAGYRYAPAPAGLELHALPVSLLVGVRTDGRAVSAALGLSGTAELKLAVGTGGAALAYGVEGGPFGQARIPIDGGAGVLLRFGVAWRLVRNRYLFDGGRAAEHLWAATVATGVEWQ